MNTAFYLSIGAIALGVTYSLGYMNAMKKSSTTPRKMAAFDETKKNLSQAGDKLKVGMTVSPSRGWLIVCCARTQQPTERESAIEIVTFGPGCT